MIDSLEINNYQAHKDTVMNFSPGVNAIVGFSDTGKSSIIRALNWCLNNKPTGTGFIRHGSIESHVQIKKNKNTIIRTKGRKANNNSYKLNENVYEGFNQDVPDNIKKVININPINIQGQFERHFLLSESAGEIARTFNKITNLEVMDISLKNLTSEKRKLEQQSSLLSTQHTNLKQQLEGFNNLKEAEQLIEQGEELEKKYDEIHQKELSLSQIMQSIIALNEELDDYIDIPKEKKIVEQGILLVEEQDKNKQKINTLSEIINNIELKQQAQDTNEKNIQKLKQKYEQLVPDICPLCEQIIKKEIKHKKATKYSSF